MYEPWSCTACTARKAEFQNFLAYFQKPYVGVVGVESIGARNVPCTQSPYVSLRLPHGGLRPIPVHDGTQWGSWALPLTGLVDDSRVSCAS